MAKQLSIDLELNSKGYRQGINDAKNATADYTNAVKLSDSNIKELNRKMKQTEREAVALGLKFDALSDAMKRSAEGQALQRDMEATIQKAAQLKNTVSDIREEINKRSSNTASLDAFKQALEVGKSAMTTYAAGIAKLTGDEKALKDMIANITIVQSGFNTAIQVAQALHRKSSLMNGIRIAQSKAATLAIKAETSATKGATAAQRVFNAVAKANPYVLLATVAITAAAAIGTYMLATKKSREEDEKAAKEKERLAALQKVYTDKLNSTATNLVTSYSKLQAQWKSLKTDMEKNQFIKQNASEFDKLGISVKNISDAEKAFVTNTSAVVASMMKRAQAAALEAKAEQLVASSLEKAERIRTRTSQYEADKKEAENMGDELIDVNGKILKSDKKRKDALKKLREDYAKDLRDLTQGMMQDRANAQKLYEKAVQINPPKFDEKEDKKDPKEVVDKLMPNTTYLGKKIDDRLKDWHNRIQENADKNWKAFKLEMQSDFILDKPGIDQRAASNLDRMLNLALGLDEDGNIVKKVDAKMEFDFSSLDEQTQEDANKTLKEFNNITRDFQESWQRIAKFHKEGNNIGVEQEMNNLDVLRQKYEELLNVLMQLNEENKKKTDENKDLTEKIKLYNNLSNAVSQAGQAFSSLGQAFNIKELNAAGIMASAIATMIESYSKAMTMAAEGLGPWGWLAFGLTGITQLGAIISQMKNLYAGSYAEGGVVPGNSYNGDRLVAMVNSGERIIPKKDNDWLEDMRKNNNINKMYTHDRIVGVISGKDILLVQKNTNRIASRSGQTIKIN